MTSENRRGWNDLLTSLAARREHALAMGGPEKLARHRSAGRVDARKRIAELLDHESFVEIGTLAGDPSAPADAFVAGSGLIDGRPVLVGSEDFSVHGGSIGTAGATKRTRIARLAKQERLPLVMMLEGAGHRAVNSLVPNRPAPNDLQAMSELAGLVPTVAVVAGPSAGHSALAAPLSDFVVMVGDDAALFAAGPPLVQAATGEQATKSELGGPRVHAVESGLVHNAAADFGEAAALVRRYLSYFPSSAWSRGAAVATGGDCGERDLDELLDLIPPDPRRAYDMRPVLQHLADSGSVMEVQPAHGGSLITALARIGGRAVAIVASQPTVLAGAIDRAAAEKAARFIERTSAFHLPLVQLADTPGVLAGSASERAGVLRASARMFTAQHRASVPKLHVTVRKAFGFGSSVMGQNAFGGQTVSLAFPGAVLGGIPAAVGGATAQYDERTQAELIENEAAGPWRLASTVTYDEIIDPRQLRNALLQGLCLAHGREQARPEPVRQVGYLP